MARIKLKLPANILVTISIPIRITDLNYGNHVGNDAIVSIIHEARVQFLSMHSMAELDAAGTALIMSELAVEYKNESFYGDVIDIAIYCGEITKVGFELYYKLSSKRKEGNVLVAHAKTAMVCYNYENKSIQSMPDRLKQIFLPSA